MKNKHNKRGLSHLLSTFNLGCGVSVESRDDGVFLHDDAYIIIINYLFQTADAYTNALETTALTEKTTREGPGLRKATW